MQPLLTADAMRAADRWTIETFGVPGFTLMETAGRAAVDRMAARFDLHTGRPVLVLAGKGNNGGDGLVVARVLHARRVPVRVVTLATPDDATDDTAHNLALLRHLAAGASDVQLDVETYQNVDQLYFAAPYALIVDALLGTGITSAVRGAAREMVGWMNDQHTPVVALDVPTGVDSDTGRVYGEAVRATATVTMGALKVGLRMNAGAVHAGEVDVAEIGIPAGPLAAQAASDGCGWEASDADVRSWLPERGGDAHKFSVGFALVVAGSEGMTGAATMSSTAAARMGAGYVKVGVPEAVQPVMAGKLTTVMPFGLPQADDGGLAEAAVDRVLEEAERAQALLVGCGLGRAESTQRFVRTLLERADLPVVIDADGLFALQDHIELIARHSDGRWILTPHWGEFRRLAGDDGLDPQDRVALAATYARRWNCVLVLKGLPSVAGCPDGRVFVNATGNAALATAGTGDVLAGMTVGLRAQGLEADRAIVAAMHIGGAAADRYAARNAPRTMQATDLLDELPPLLHERFGDTGE